jgi:lipoyl(octanoyl) transferase
VVSGLFAYTEFVRLLSTECPAEPTIPSTDIAIMSDTIRVLQDGACDGVVNMSRDESLLLAVGAGTSPPTLRLYGWAAPTISLGYFQCFEEYESLAAPAGGLPVVRRTTGGGAILHDRELTYALIVPASSRLVHGNPNRLYELAHDALIACLAELGVSAQRSDVDDGSGASKGPFFCFARRHRYDVVIGGDKLAGSAQRRSGDAILQHGSIVSERRFDQQPAASLCESGVSADAVRAGWVESLALMAGVAFDWGEWTTDESSKAVRLADKYASDDWTQRR